MGSPRARAQEGTASSEAWAAMAAICVAFGFCCCIQLLTAGSGTGWPVHRAYESYSKLKPSCVDSGVSYEDRIARRKEEIESLQEALKILNGEDIA